MKLNEIFLGVVIMGSGLSAITFFLKLVCAILFPKLNKTVIK